MYGKYSTLLYNNDTNFNHIIKMSVNFGAQITRSFLRHICQQYVIYQYIMPHIFLRMKKNPTINKKVGTTEQIFVLDPAN